MAPDTEGPSSGGRRAGPRILVIKLADFGDALLTTPALALLRDTLPEARLEALCRPAGAVALERSEFLDAIHVLPAGLWSRLKLLGRLRGAHYDALIYLHSLITWRGALKHGALALGISAPLRVGLAPPATWRAAFLNQRVPDRGYGAWHVAESFEAVADLALTALAAPPASRGSASRVLRFRPGAAAEAAAAQMAETWPAAASWVAIHPGGGNYSLARRWPAERFARLAEALVRRGHAVALVGRAADGTAAVRALCQAPLLDLTDACDLPTLAALLPRFRRLITNDSGVMHLAVAMGTPVTAIFGPSSDRSWGPWDPIGRDVQAGDPGAHRVAALVDLPCRPCLYVGHRLGAPAGCSTRDCLSWLSVERVLASAPDL